MSSDLFFIYHQQKKRKYLSSFHRISREQFPLHLQMDAICLIYDHYYKTEFQGSGPTVTFFLCSSKPNPNTSQQSPNTKNAERDLKPNLQKNSVRVAVPIPEDNPLLYSKSNTIISIRSDSLIPFQRIQNNALRSAAKLAKTCPIDFLHAKLE